MSNLDKRDETAQFIQKITDALKCDMSDRSRGLLVAHREQLRQQLAALEGPDTLASLGLGEWDFSVKESK